MIWHTKRKGGKREEEEEGTSDDFEGQRGDTLFVLVCGIKNSPWLMQCHRSA